MKRQRFLRATLGLGALAVLGGNAATGPPLLWRRRTLLGFGTTLSLQAAHADARTLDSALDAGVAALRRIEAQMSLFNPTSAISQLNRDGMLAAPPAELREVLEIAQAISRGSDGAFDVTVQPLWQVFEAAQRTGHLPDAREIDAARERVGWRGLELSGEGVHLRRPGMAVTLNGIAQGYAADRVRRVLVMHGIRHALVDTGEFATLGHNANARPWTLGIANPRDEAALIARLMSDGRCIATSADSVTSFSADRRHHHIFDPRTGYSPPALAGVTVAAGSGAIADALTKVMFVAGPRRAFSAARQWNADVLWVDKAGGWRATPGLRLTGA
ncbi:FAD:protein FMN transferase [Ramlibacter sp. WS9]|uniref:FAD:protein FMN transferase n=1 Tax=Ramlibacter sp. WS9 TaxID=1882741 RepID=UPI0011444B28|nr:FAD:protein FMN transferase [Ramlibacter sp. WS9]ROZ78666.1 FAD:protein FMN transferase [Ramlibacter sp. WS9]